MAAEPPRLRSRTIDAPEQEWLDSAQLAAYLGLSSHHSVEKLVKDGLLPPGMPWGERGQMWHWQIVVAISLARLGGCVLVPKKEGEIRPNKARQGQSEPNKEEDD